MILMYREITLNQAPFTQPFPVSLIVKCAPVGSPDLRRQSSWAPDGAGFARVSVIDAKGASDSVVVRLQ